MPQGKGTYGSRRGRPPKKRAEYKVGRFVKDVGKHITSNVIETPKVTAKIITNQVKGIGGVAKRTVKGLAGVPKQIAKTNKGAFRDLKKFATDKNYRRQNFKDIGDAFRRNKNSGGYIAGPN